MNDTLSFEQMFTRLEAILERMNAPDISLEESLTLFEEANTLLSLSTKKLQEAEKKVELLTKNRQGEILFTEEGKPQTTPISL